MKSNSRMKLRALTEERSWWPWPRYWATSSSMSCPTAARCVCPCCPYSSTVPAGASARGCLPALAFSLLQLLLDGAYAWGWQSMLGDYIVAFTVLGLAGLFYKNKNGFFIGTVVGCVARFLVAWYVGAVVWGETMPDSFFGMTMTSPWFYSALYNGSYMILNMLICLVVGALPVEASWQVYPGRGPEAGLKGAQIASAAKFLLTRCNNLVYNDHSTAYVVGWSFDL